MGRVEVESLSLNGPHPPRLPIQQRGRNWVQCEGGKFTPDDSAPKSVACSPVYSSSLTSSGVSEESACPWHWARLTHSWGSDVTCAFRFSETIALNKRR
jgi:hypothetical protein